MKTISDLHCKLVHLHGIAYATSHLDNELAEGTCEKSNARTCLIDTLYAELELCRNLADTLSTPVRGAQ